MIEVQQKAVKCPIGWKGLGNIKTAEMGDKKVIIQIIDKVRYHGKAFAFHNNKSTVHSMAGKTFTFGGRVLMDG